MRAVPKETGYAKLKIYDIFGSDPDIVGDYLNDVAGYNDSNMMRLDALLKAQDAKSDAFLPLNASKTMTGNVKYNPHGTYTSTPLDLRKGNENGDCLLLTAGALTVLGSGEFPQNYYAAAPNGYNAATETLVLGSDNQITFATAYQTPANAYYMQMNSSGQLVPLAPANGIGQAAVSIGAAGMPWANGYFSSLAVNNTIQGGVTGNAGTATKLGTARTITAGADVSGSVSFDGGANVTFGMTVNQASKLRTARTVTAGTDVTGSMNFDGSDNVTFGMTVNQASKLRTARTITAGTDVTGSMSFDGSANVTFGMTVNKATALRTARKINGVEFDGTKDIAIEAGETGRIPLQGSDQINGSLIPKSDITVSLGSSTRRWLNVSAYAFLGNASTASKINVERNITFTGNTTGTFSFDGSKDTTCELTTTDANHAATLGKSSTPVYNTLSIRDASMSNYYNGALYLQNTGSYVVVGIDGKGGCGVNKAYNSDRLGDKASGDYVLKSGTTFTGNAIAYGTNRSGTNIRNIRVQNSSNSDVSTNYILMKRK